MYIIRIKNEKINISQEDQYLITGQITLKLTQISD